MADRIASAEIPCTNPISTEYVGRSFLTAVYKLRTSECDTFDSNGCVSPSHPKHPLYQNSLVFGSMIWQALRSWYLMEGLFGSIHWQRLACAAVALVVLATSTSQGALIQFLGSDSDAEQWRNPAVNKPLDLSGDNVYGTDGYVAFGTSPVGTSNGITSNGVNPFTYVNGSRQTLASRPSYVSGFTPDANFSTVMSGFSYENANDPRVAGGGATIETGVAPRPGVLLTFAPLFSFTVTAAVPKNFEVGLFFNEPLSVTPTWRVSSNLGGSASAGQLISVPTFNALFFTISNATSGEVFTVSGQATLGVSSLDISAITFDTVAPEPSTLAVSAFAVAAFVWLGGSRRQTKCGCVARNSFNAPAPNESG